MRGLFIVVEGIDGTGKSTQCRMLAEWLRAQGREVITSREPTDGPWGREIRASYHNRRSAEEELELFIKDRRQHVEELIRPSLAAGKVVILDRYYFSTMAYQGLRGFDVQEIRIRNEEFAPVPDLLLILDLEVDVALARIGARGDIANEFERRDALAGCRETFLTLAEEPFARLIDASVGPEDVQAAIRLSLPRSPGPRAEPADPPSSCPRSR